MPTLFLSYSEKDTPVANIIEDTLKLESNNQITISRYTRVGYMNSFVQFMNSISEHDYVMCIVSDNYLKSKACLYEVGQILRDGKYKSKQIWVILNKNDYLYYKNTKYKLEIANIYGNVSNRLSYVTYWKNEYIMLEQKIEAVNDPLSTRLALKDLYEIDCICKNDISEFLDFIAEYKGLSLSELIDNHFKDILTYIFPSWNLQLFEDCKNYESFFNKAISYLHDVTSTDYNQIILLSQINSHETGLVVVADDVPKHKQRYRLVVMSGLIAESFKDGEIKNLKETDDKKYFCAVLETRSELAVPIIINGNVIGVINSESEEINHFSQDIENKVWELSNNISVQLQKFKYKIDSNVPYIHI